MPHSTTLVASAARTATLNTTAATPRGGAGVLLVVDVTAITATPSVTPSILVRDENGDYNATIWTAAAAITDVTGTGNYTYLLYPGAIAADFDGTEAVGFGVPAEWQLTMTHGDTDSITYSVRAHYLE